MKPTRLALKPLTLAAWLACQAHAQTLPGTATVVNGIVDVQRFTNGVQVTNTPGAIVHWDRFSVGAGNTVRFVQQGPSSAVLNRVTGNTASQIHGALQSNGRVFLLNPNGILFGTGARVDVAGLLASTLDIADQDFLDGKYHFKCFNAIACEGGVDALNPLTNRVVLEDGSQITTRNAGEGGQVWLIARDRVVTEKGSHIEAPSGQVMAATAREVSITSPTLGQMRFTLTGTAGSRIDLAGDIDVPRGAAGFFADTVRFAGAVRARSDVGAAGQIVASAAANVVVDADARLDVSGTPGADAGAVRLGATQQIQVSAAAEIAADGGVPGAHGGGKGGLIELSAAAVQLPGLLGERDASPLQLHARGYGTQGLDLARYGSVEVTESGNFGYTVVDGPAWTSSDTGQQNVRTGEGHAHGITVTATDQTQLALVAAAGDGRYLVITVRSAQNVYRENQQAPTIPSLNDVRAVSSNVYTALLVGADGQVIRSQALGRSDFQSTQLNGPANVATDTPESTFQAVGLSKGGWAVLEQGAHNRVLFLSADRGTIATVNVAQGATLRPLLAGGLLVEVAAGASTQRLVFDRLGGTVADVAAALAGEQLGRPLAYQQLNPLRTPVDERREWRSDSAGLQRLVDLADDSVVRSVQAETPLFGVGAVLGTGLLGHGPGLGTSSHSTTPLGAWDKGVFTQFAQARYDYEGQSTTFTQASNMAASGPSFLRALHSGAMVMLGTTETRSSQEQTVRNAGPNLNTYTSSRSEQSQNTVQLLTRKLLNEPFAATGTQGTVLVPPLLAAQAGVANGTRGGVAQPPVPAPPPPPPPPAPPAPIPAPPAPTPAPAAPVPAPPAPTPAPAPTAPTPAPPPPVSEIPPPPYQPPTRPATGPAPLPGLSVIDVARLRTGDVRGPVRNSVVSEEFLDDSRAVIGDALGPEAVDAFNRGTDDTRRKILDDARWAYFLDDKDLQAATRNMSRDMRGTTLNALSMLQSYGTLESEALDQGLRRALTVKVTPPQPASGSAPGPARTALETELNILESELLEATRMRMRADGQGEAERQAAELEHKRVTGRIARALVVAAREAAGEDVNDSGDLEIANNGESRMVLTEQGELRSQPL